MKQLYTLGEATEAFLAYSPEDMKDKYQLERMRQLMAFLDNPQERLKVIHIAGTSGKTSTAYFIRGMLEAAEQRTGLTVSPHIAGINDRVQIDGLPLAEQRFLAYVNRFFKIIAETNLQPTYFELLIALAYWVFAQEKVDYAVVEAGLGGLIDGTNVVARQDKICVITDIGLDHTEILGETIAEITTQKAGIIQLHNQVFMNSQSSEVMDIINTTAKRQQASFKSVSDKAAPESLPYFQHRNWALAKAVFEYIQDRDNLPSITTQLTEIARQTPPGRWERYHYKDKIIILDGAHNQQKLQALCDSLAAAGIQSVALLANLTEAPEAKIIGSLKILLPVSSRLIIPEFQAGQGLKSRHSLSARQLSEKASRLGFSSITEQPDIHRALQLLLESPEKVLLITGSFYLVSALRPSVIKATSLMSVSK